MKLKNELELSGSPQILSLSIWTCKVIRPGGKEYTLGGASLPKAMVSTCLTAETFKLDKGSVCRIWPGTLI